MLAEHKGILNINNSSNWQIILYVVSLGVLSSVSHYSIRSGKLMPFLCLLLCDKVFAVTYKTLDFRSFKLNM
jgi:hypothetical protein